MLLRLFVSAFMGLCQFSKYKINYLNYSSKKKALCSNISNRSKPFFLLPFFQSIHTIFIFRSKAIDAIK